MKKERKGNEHEMKSENKKVSKKNWRLTTSSGELAKDATGEAEQDHEHAMFGAQPVGGLEGADHERGIDGEVHVIVNSDVVSVQGALPGLSVFCSN